MSAGHPPRPPLSPIPDKNSELLANPEHIHLRPDTVDRTYSQLDQGVDDRVEA